MLIDLWASAAYVAPGLLMAPGLLDRYRNCRASVLGYGTRSNKSGADANSASFSQCLVILTIIAVAVTVAELPL